MNYPSVYLVQSDLVPKLRIPNWLPLGKLYRNKMIASVVIPILFLLFIEYDLSTIKMNWYLLSRSDGKSWSSKDPSEKMVFEVS